MTTTTTVNGFQCKNCTDIDYAKKHIDPARPKDGPYGVNAKTNGSEVRTTDRVQPDPAVRFGGQLQNVQASDRSAKSSPTADQLRLLDVRA